MWSRLQDLWFYELARGFREAGRDMTLPLREGRTRHRLVLGQNENSHLSSGYGRAAMVISSRANGEEMCACHDGSNGGAGA